MFFKNINPYQLSKRIDAKELAKLLSEKEFKSCLPSEESSAGFDRVTEDFGFVLSIEDIHLFCLKVEEKSIPPSVVNAKYKSLLAEEKRRGIILSNSERTELKAYARKSLLPKTFGKISRIWAYIDNHSQTLIINTSSPKVADGLASTIRNRFSSVEVKPFQPDSDVPKTLTQWMLGGLAPDPFSLGRKCEINDGKGTIKYSNRSLDDQQLRSYLEDGLKLASLGLCYKESVYLLLSSDFVIREIECQTLSSEFGRDIDNLGSDIKKDLLGMARMFRECLNDLKNSIDARQ